MEFVIKSAEEFSDEDIKIFKKIVVDANEVLEETFDGLIEKNPLLLFLPNSENPKAIGALKVPGDRYREKVFRKSQTSLNPTDFKYEIGWIVSLKEDEGLGQEVIKVLSNYKSEIYATARVENKAMNHILEKFGFIKTGNPYDSERGNYKINLYIKQNRPDS
ncbi:hypothetical protein [Gracilimonas sp.]|uniref:hypothetical protein n=1 Tax=Gracilimonas sp. TaxID=1974203 RepID=UPI003BAC9632